MEKKTLTKLKSECRLILANLPLSTLFENSFHLYLEGNLKKLEVTKLYKLKQYNNHVN